MVEEQRAAGEEQPDRELHRVDAADEIVLVHEVEQRDRRRRRVVHGVNGRNDGRTSIPNDRRSATASAASAAVCPLSRRSRIASFTDSNADTTKMQPAAASSGHRSAWRSTCSTLTVQSNVRLREALVHRTDDPHRVLRRVEEVGIAERDVGRARGDELLDVGEHRGCVGDADPPVVDDRNRAVATPVRAAAAGFDRADDACRSRRRPGARSGRAGGAGRAPGAGRRVPTASRPSWTAVAGRCRARPSRRARPRTRPRSRRRRRRRTCRRRARSSRSARRCSTGELARPCGSRCAWAPRTRPCRPTARAPDPTGRRTRRWRCTSCPRASSSAAGPARLRGWWPSS